MSYRSGFAGYVAWTMLDGNVMAGRVEYEGYDTCNVHRVDGSLVTVKTDRLRPATESDVNAAIRFYQTLGRNS